MASEEILAENNPEILVCPKCGYDLRASGEGRCSECGLMIDRSLLAISGFPWAHRQGIGRLRAYIKTVWQVSVGSQRLAFESAKPQDARDGRAFRRVTAAIVAVVLVVGFSAVWVAEGGLAFLAVQPNNPFGTRSGFDGPLLDLAVPWSAGATIPGILPMCLIFLAIWLTGAQRSVFRLGAFPPAYRERALAIANYMTAPLALLFPAAALIASGLLIQLYGADIPELRRLVIAAVLAGEGIVFCALVGTLWRTGQWVERAKHCGLASAAMATGELVGLWLIGGVIALGLLPWCIGFFWIVIDSFL